MGDGQEACAQGPFDQYRSPRGQRGVRADKYRRRARLFDCGDTLLHIQVPRRRIHLRDSRQHLHGRADGHGLFPLRQHDEAGLLHMRGDDGARRERGLRRRLRCTRATQRSATTCSAWSSRRWRRSGTTGSRPRASRGRCSRRTGTNREHAEGFVEYLKEIGSVEVACLIRELEEGRYKISIRSKGGSRRGVRCPRLRRGRPQGRGGLRPRRTRSLR